MAGVVIYDGTVIARLGSFQRQLITAAGQTMDVATPSRDCTSGAYPALLTTGHVGGLISLLAYRPLAWQTGFRQRARSTGSFRAA